MKNRNSICISLILTFLTIILSGSVHAVSSDDITIYTIKKGYKSAKNEPEKGIYLGSYVLQNDTIKFSMNVFNRISGKKHASYFKYVGYGRPFPHEWVEQVKSVGAVPHIAWEPNNGLEKVKDDKYMRDFAKAAGKANVPIFLRYASEMNGDWTHYSGKSKLYKEKWKLVYSVMKQEAPNVIMVWTVFTFPDYNIQPFYPGDEYVDWVGVNLYNVIYHNFNKSSRADHEDPLKLLDYVYNLYSYKKPIQISEYGVTHYTSADGKYYVDYAKEKLERLYGNLPSKYPRVKSIFYFDVNKIDKTPNGLRINNYLLTDNQEILKTYSRLIQDERYLSHVVKENSNPVDEKLSYRGSAFKLNGRTYADIEFYKNYLGLKVEVTSTTARVSDGQKTAVFNIISKRIPKGYYNEYNRVNGLPIREVAVCFGYKLDYNPSDNSILIAK